MYSKFIWLLSLFSIMCSISSCVNKTTYHLPNITFREKPYEQDEKFAYFKGTGEFKNHRKKIEYDFYGNPKSIYQYKNEKMDTFYGPWVTFFQSGNKKGQGYFFNGNKNGKWIAYYDLLSDGKQIIAAEEHYLDDGLHGSLQHFHQNKKIAADYNYNNNRKDGLQKKWYENGNLMYEAKFEMGKKIYEKQFDENGELIKM